MLSYMLPVEEKSPSVTAASAAAAAARNLSLNLNNPANPGGSSSSKQQQFKDANGGGSVASVGNGTARVTSSSGKVIKSAIKTNHRYQLVSSSSSSVEENGSGSGNGPVTNGKKKFSKRNGAEEPVHNGGNAGEDLSDEHTSLLGGTTGSSKSVKSDKNFNNLIVVNGNVNGGKLASVLKKNGSGNGTTAATVNGDGPLKVVTTTNGAYSAVRSSENDEEDDEDVAEPEAHYHGEEEDEEFDLVVAANNRKNTGVITAKMSTSASVTRNLNGINGNGGGGAGAAPQQQSSVETPSSGIIVDTSDADSEQTAVSGVSGGGGGGGGGKKVKMNKLGGSKNVTLKRVSFGSSKGSMVETLVFETPTPLPEHAEREFFHSPAVLAGAGTTVNSVHHYQQQHHHHLPHYHHPMQQHPHQQQGQSQQSDSSLVGLDDSGIELQEEVERSKVRVSFFQSSKPQSISPPDSLLFGGQNLIHFGPGSGGGGGGGGGYDNNNTLLDSSYITSAALNQQYDSLLAGHHHNHNSSTFQYNPEDPNSMAAVMAYDRQMSTESGWDNPFRPGGDLSREADEIVNLIKGGKPITPTGDQSLLNGSAPKDSSHDGPTENGGSTVVDGVVTKLESSQLQSQQPNGTKSPQKDAAPATTAAAAAASPQKNGSTPAAASHSPAAANQTQVSNQVIPGPQSASHVVIDEKKKKKCACCVIQ